MMFNTHTHHSQTHLEYLVNVVLTIYFLTPILRTFLTTYCNKQCFNHVKYVRQNINTITFIIYYI